MSKNFKNFKIWEAILHTSLMPFIFATIPDVQLAVILRESCYATDSTEQRGGEKVHIELRSPEVETPSVGFVKVSLLQSANQLKKMANVMIEMEQVYLRNADEDEDEDTFNRALVSLQ